jgi:malate dehydrogenase (oxaloacetate-decarboxylating)(NADP+)
MAFTLEERQQMGIHGLLPPAVVSQDLQVYRVMVNFHRAQGKSIFYINY